MKTTSSKVTDTYGTAPVFKSEIESNNNPQPAGTAISSSTARDTLLGERI